MSELSAADIMFPDMNKEAPASEFSTPDRLAGMYDSKDWNKGKPTVSEKPAQKPTAQAQEPQAQEKGVTPSELDTQWNSWSEENYDKAVEEFGEDADFSPASTALAAYGDQELIDLARQFRLDTHPAVLRFLLKIGADI